MTIYLATRNEHKLREVQRMMYLEEILPLPERVKLPPETGKTFEENALIKARAASKQLGAAVIADDSGIQADALGGRPGVRSARFAGENATDDQNLRKFIAEVPPGDRIAYVCVVAYVHLVDEAELTFKERCTGTMASEPRGENGFGYDPIFIPDEYPDKTMAELTPEQKDKISHRGKAVRRAAYKLVSKHGIG